MNHTLIFSSNTSTLSLTSPDVFDHFWKMSMINTPVSSSRFMKDISLRSNSTVKTNSKKHASWCSSFRIYEKIHDHISSISKSSSSTFIFITSIVSSSFSSSDFSTALPPFVLCCSCFSNYSAINFFCNKIFSSYSVCCCCSSSSSSSEPSSSSPASLLISFSLLKPCYEFLHYFSHFLGSCLRVEWASSREFELSSMPFQ